MWDQYISAANIEEVISALDQYREKARVVAGGTDLILEMERGVRPDVKILVDITRIPGLDQIVLDDQQWIHLGPRVTHNDCANSKLIREMAYPLARAAWEVGSPQIRNRGTIAGNVITGSPANDTISPLMALGAQVVLRSTSGTRIVPLEKFYLGVRRTTMQSDEALVDIRFPALQQNQRGTFIKYALRHAQAISLVNAAVIVTIENQKITQASITLGSVAPTIIHAVEAETYLVGRSLTESVIAKAAKLASDAARPITDVRSSASYRRAIVEVIVIRALNAILNKNETLGFPVEPVLLSGGLDRRKNGTVKQSQMHHADTPIVTTINGKVYTFETGQNKTLLRLLREDAGLIGTKEGCAEGECGACTVYLDGMAVMSCMVPAPRAHGAEITTVEGISEGDVLHPVQQAFVEKGAVQCGYCTPGFVMSAAKLLEEYPQPSREQIQQAITGNLCRCTGYYKIVEAIELAALLKQQGGDNHG